MMLGRARGGDRAQGGARTLVLGGQGRGWAGHGVTGARKGQGRAPGGRGRGEGTGPGLGRARREVTGQRTWLGTGPGAAVTAGCPRRPSTWRRSSWWGPRWWDGPSCGRCGRSSQVRAEPLPPACGAAPCAERARRSGHRTASPTLPLPHPLLQGTPLLPVPRGRARRGRLPGLSQGDSQHPHPGTGLMAF